MKLSEYLAPERVVTDVEPGDVPGILRQLLDPLLADGTLPEADAMLSALLAREKILSTGIGHGIAVPHAISASVRHPLVILGLSAPGVDYDAMDGGPVHIFFVLLSPPDSASHHTQMLARIARLGRDPEFVAALSSQTDPHAALGCVEEYEKTHG